MDNPADICFEEYTLSYRSILRYVLLICLIIALLFTLYILGYLIDNLYPQDFESFEILIYSAVVTLVNILLEQVVKAASPLIKMRNKSQEASLMMTTLYLAFLLNLTLPLILLNLDLSSYAYFQAL